MKLPYELSKGVTATREGLVFDVDAPVPMAACLAAAGHSKITVGMRTTWKWSDAAERLRYREGEPWCHTESPSAVILCVSPEYCDVAAITPAKLHRLAAIACDDAAAFKVLHTLLDTSASARSY